LAKTKKGLGDYVLELGENSRDFVSEIRLAIER
jgi:hypothetical protein